jgi:hypothetical protein
MVEVLQVGHALGDGALLPAIVLLEEAKFAIAIGNTRCHLSMLPHMARDAERPAVVKFRAAAYCMRFFMVRIPIAIEDSAALFTLTLSPHPNIKALGAGK